MDVFKTVVSAKHDPRYGGAGAVRGGVLNHADLDFIWKAPLYPPELHPFLLAVLEKFEVLHRLEGTLTSSLFFPHSEPERQLRRRANSLPSPSGQRPLIR